MTCIRTSGRALLFLLAAVTFIPAQQPPVNAPQTATIMGTVQDVTGGTVAHAHVVLEGQKQSQSFITGEDGFFTFDNVTPAAPFRIEISASDFKSWVSDEIVLQPWQSFIVSGIRLSVATVETSVSAVTPEEVAVEQVKIQEQQRVLGVVPNFFVSYERDAAPLTPKLKFQLAGKALTDPVTMTVFGVNAGIYQAAGYPSYGQGAAAYGKRLGATFAGGYSKILLGDALFASLLHQDPRYFYQGTGTTKSRLEHAMATPFFRRGDDDKRHINYSSILGDLASGALANTYYPSQDRGAGLVVRSAAVGVGTRMALGILQEFVLHKWTTQH